MMRTMVWKGNMSLNLSLHAQMHRNCYFNIVEEIEHCNHERPTKRTQVELFKSYIKCNASKGNAILAKIDAD